MERNNIMSRLRSKKTAGFTLIELMVVVAIIGILAVVAVPQYNRFQNQARQSEAQSVLGGVSTAMKAYNARFGQFHNCLPIVGYAPDGWPATGATAANSRHPGRYTVGIGNPNILAFPAGGATTCTLLNSAPTIVNVAAGAAGGNGTGFYLGTSPAGFTALAGLSTQGAITATTFTARAEALLRPTVAASAANNDGWSITETGVLTNTVVGF